MTQDLTRRAWIRLAAVGALPAMMQESQQVTDDVAPLHDPRMVGRPRARVTDYENDPFIVGVERQIRCTCGCNLDVYTCRTTDFTCATSPALHREIIGMVERDYTAEQILDAFIEEHGESILMAPPKAGFNWAGYLLPGITISFTGLVLGWVIIRRTQHVRVAETSAATELPFSDLSGQDASLLQAELDNLGD